MTDVEISDLALGLATILAVVLRIEQKLLRIEAKVIMIEANLTGSAAT